MSTFMTWETSGGKKGRCDARCHNAKRPKCRCMCGGDLHGKARGITPREFEDFKDEVIENLKLYMMDHVDHDKIDAFRFIHKQRGLFREGVEG